MKKLHKKIKKMCFSVMMLFGISTIALAAEYKYVFVLTCSTDVYVTANRPLSLHERVELYRCLEIACCGQYTGGDSIDDEEGNDPREDITEDQDGSTCLI